MIRKYSFPFCRFFHFLDGVRKFLISMMSDFFFPSGACVLGVTSKGPSSGPLERKWRLQLISGMRGSSVYIAVHPEIYLKPNFLFSPGDTAVTRQSLSPPC